MSLSSLREHDLEPRKTQTHKGAALATAAFDRMTSIFDGYDEEYRALTSDISKKISEVASYEDQHGASCDDGLSKRR